MTGRERLDVLLTVYAGIALLVLSAAIVFGAVVDRESAQVARAWLDEWKFREVVEKGGLADGDS